MPRGTLQTEFVHKPFAELRRLGLTRDTEARVREAYPRQTGLLVVEQVIPESAASSQLEPGDMVVEVDGKLIAEFVPLAAVLDAAVGREVTVIVERGGQRLERRVMVDDLHAITPAEYIEYGDGVFHKLVVSAGAALLSLRGRRLRRQFRLRVRQGRDPARQHRDRDRQRRRCTTSTISSACSSRCRTTRRCPCAS